MKKIVSFLATFSLLGCTATQHTPTNGPKFQGWEKYENTLLEYTILIPEKAFIPDKSQTKNQVFFGNMKAAGETPVDSFDVLLLGEDPPKCDAWNLAITNPKQTLSPGAPSVWGKVDYWDTGVNEGVDTIPSTLCSPPRLWSEEWYIREPGQFAAYALCSEKDGKRVVVCVQQMTDNPELAEEIFSTFRWTE